MTRAEKAAELSALVFPPTSSEGIVQAQRLFDVIAAELAKTCGNCKWFVGARDEVRWAACAARGGMHSIPVDGSGFCYRWESR